jgi:hypothetical protein
VNDRGTIPLYTMQCLSNNRKYQSFNLTRPVDQVTNMHVDLELSILGQCSLSRSGKAYVTCHLPNTRISSFLSHRFFSSSIAQNISNQFTNQI